MKILYVEDLLKLNINLGTVCVSQTEVLQYLYKGHHILFFARKY